MTRDERAKEIIESEIRKGWPDIVRWVDITPRTDFLGEPAFDVLVGLKSIQQVPTSIARGDMIARLGDVLAEIGDARATHFAFAAPDEIVDGETDDEEELQGSNP